METNTLSNIVARYKSSSNSTIKDDFFKCCNYLTKHKTEVTDKEYVQLLVDVYKHYLKLLNSNPKKYPFKDYIQADWQLVKPFKESLNQLEQQDQEPNFQLDSFIGKYDPYTELDMLYLVELYTYRYNKKHNLTNKYCSTATDQNPFQIETLELDTSLQGYIDKIDQTTTLDELIQAYDSTVKDVAKEIHDSVEQSNTDSKNKKTAKEKLFQKYKTQFNKKLYKFEETMKFNSPFYTSHDCTLNCIHTLLSTMNQTNKIEVMETIVDVINYRLRTHRHGQHEHQLYNELLYWFNDLVKDGMDLETAVQYVINPKFRKEYDVAMEQQYKEAMTEVEPYQLN